MQVPAGSGDPVVRHSISLGRPTEWDIAILLLLFVERSSAYAPTSRLRQYPWHAEGGVSSPRAPLLLFVQSGGFPGRVPYSGSPTASRASALSVSDALKPNDRPATESPHVEDEVQGFIYDVKTGRLSEVA
jgi:hypothetical protein